MNAKVEELLELLSQRGLKDEAVESVKEGLWAQANEALMDQVLSSLTDDDLQQVESSATQDEANQKFAALFEQKSGKNMQDEMTTILNQYAEDLIKRYTLGGDAPAVSTSIDMTNREDEAKFFPSGDEAVQTTPALEMDDMVPPVPPLPDNSQIVEKSEEDKVHDLS